MRLSRSCYAIPGLCCVPPWWHNAGFVVGEGRTLLVDTGGNVAAAQTIHGYANAVKPGQPLVAVNTEPHLDHLLGNAFFADRGAEVLDGDVRRVAVLVPAEALAGSAPARAQMSGHGIIESSKVFLRSTI